MYINEIPKPTGFIKPVFLNKETQQTYDASQAMLPEPVSLPDTTTSKNENVAQAFNAKAFKFSPLMAGFSGKSFSLPTSTQPSDYKINTNTRTTTPQISTRAPITTPLNTNFNKLGAITTKWGESTRYEKFHPGIDIANKTGTPIPAFAGGTVTSVETGKRHGDKGYGNTVIVTDAQGNKHRYSHLHQVFVKVGQKVGGGQEIATMGDTGSTYSPAGKGTGTHLDYRITDAYNKYVNPNSYLKKLT